MENLKPEIEEELERQEMNKEKIFFCPSRRVSPSSITTIIKYSNTQVKLAAIAVGLNIRLKSSDMPADMQERAFRYTRTLVDAATNNHRPKPSPIALALKKEFDSLYGLAWHCVVGKSFGSFVTHSTGGFLYFSLDNLSFLLFKTEVRLVTGSSPE